MTTGLVGFTLFGDNDLYSVGALKQLILFQNFSKEGPVQWDCRYYVGKSVPRVFLRSLEAAGGQIESMGYPEDQTATFWRHKAFCADYDYVLMRDCDSRLSEREKVAIQGWVKSHKGIHIIRDHPFHGVPMLAGLWGASRPQLEKVAELCPPLPPEDFYQEVNRRAGGEYYKSNDFYQVDQWWLRQKVFHQFKYDKFVNDEFFGFERKRFKSPLPPRENGEFIGEGFDQNDNPRFPEHRLVLGGPGWPS